jgi:hypothetical protein
MGSRSKIIERWRYLRQMLIQQLDAFERGAIQMHSNDIDISPAAIARLKRDIAEFDALIAEDEATRG